MAANKQLMLYIKQRLRESIALDILAASACAVGFFPSPLLTIQCENTGGKRVCVRQHYDSGVCFKSEGLLRGLARALYPLDSANLSGNKSLGLTVSIKQINTFLPPFALNIFWYISCCQALALSKGLSMLVPPACAKCRIEGLRPLMAALQDTLCALSVLLD